MGREGRRRVGGGLRVARALTVCLSLGETCWHEKPSAAAGSKRLERDTEREDRVAHSLQASLDTAGTWWHHHR